MDLALAASNCLAKRTVRTGGRVVEGARLESVYTFIAYRGFESPSVRQNSKALAQQCVGAFFLAAFYRVGEINNSFVVRPCVVVAKKVADREPRKISAGLESLAFASLAILREEVFRVAARRREMIASWQNRNAQQFAQ